MSLNREQLTAFVGAAVRFGEISMRSPYVSSYSTGLSGLTYGVFQHDTSKNDGAQSTLALILSAEVERGALTRKKADALYTATINSTASKKISAANRELIDQALLAQQPIVDSADQGQLNVVMDYVDSAFDAASRNPNGAGDLDRADPNLALIAEMAMWANRSNGLDASNKFVEKMEVITKDAWRSNYLAKQAQFGVKGESFTKWTTKVDNGIIRGHIAVLTAQLTL